MAGAEVIVTLAPIVQPPAPTLQPRWLGDRFLALPADFNASFLPDVSEGADLFLADDIGQYRYYQGQGQFGGWGVPERTAGQALDTPNTAARVVCATSASAPWMRRSPTPRCRPRPGRRSESACRLTSGAPRW